MKKLKQQYDQIIDQYIKIFEKKHGLEFEFFVGDDNSGVACFGDIFYFNISDILFCINNKLPKHLIIDWLYDSIEFNMIGSINLNSYWKGLRYKDLNNFEKF